MHALDRFPFLFSDVAVHPNARLYVRGYERLSSIRDEDDNVTVTYLHVPPVPVALLLLVVF